MRNESHVSVISFDIDGTLVDFQKVIDCALTELGKEFGRLFGRTLTPNELHGLRNEVAAETAFATARLEVIRRESFHRAIMSLDVDPDQYLDAVCQFFFTRRFTLNYLYPDVIPTLRALRAHGLRTIAASNGNSYLSNTDVAPLMDAMFYAEDIGVRKPNPDFYKEVARRIGTCTEEICHVGDSLIDDYQAALAAGMKARLLHRSSTPSPENIAVISSLKELIGVWQFS